LLKPRVTVFDECTGHARDRVVRDCSCSEYWSSMTSLPTLDPFRRMLTLLHDT
jgi:hypothetical protein